ncbi:unnamed protein product, partial [Rotaria socialis]
MSNPTLLDLPLELFHGIFEHLDTETIAISVRCVCKKLFNIANNYDKFKLSLARIYGSDLVSISRIVEPVNFVSLAIYVYSDYHQYGKINLFLSLFKLNSFTQLRSLYFYSTSGDTVELFLQQVPLGNLGLLSIINTRDGILGRAIKQTLQSVVQFNIPKLQIYEPKCLERINWPAQCPLEYLMLADCSFSQYRSVLSELSNLRMLIVDNIKMTDKDLKTQEEFSISQNAAKTQDCQHLTSLSIVKFDGTMEDIELILSLTPSLTRLRLISCRKKFDSTFDGSTWERTIGSKLPLLKNFELFLSHEFWRDVKFPLLCEIIAPFQSTFWLNQKHCNFSADYDLWNPIIRLYTTPICATNDQHYYSSGYFKCVLSSKESRYSITQNQGCSVHFSDYSKTALVQTITTLSIKEIKVGSNEMKHLYSALEKNTTIEDLALRDIKLDNNGLKSLAHALSVNKTIIKLNISSNRFGDDGMKHLAEALHNNTTMTMLNISYNNVGDDGARDLANALYNNKTLTNLNLSGNDITNIGVEHLFVALQDNSTLKVLELGSCKTGHKGAMHLACLLRTNQ